MVRPLKCASDVPAFGKPLVINAPSVTAADFTGHRRPFKATLRALRSQLASR